MCITWLELTWWWCSLQISACYEQPRELMKFPFGSLDFKKCKKCVAHSLVCSYSDDYDYNQDY